MTSDDRETIRRSMGEAAALQADDPQRQEIERKIAGQEGWAQEEWRELLRESQALREEFPQVEMPVNLQSRLLALPDKVTQPRRLAPRWRWLLAVAAGVLVLLGVLGIGRNWIHSSRLRTVALLAIDNHLNDRHVSVDTSDAGQLNQALTPQVPFDVVVPDLGPKFQLLGGRKCALGTHPVVYSLWRGPEGEYSLFQLRTSDFGLPAQLPRKRIHTNVPAAANHPCGAVIWTEGEFGYVLVSGRENDSP